MMAATAAAVTERACPQVSPEDVPDLTRGPVFLAASVLMGAVLVVIVAVCGVGNLLFVASVARSGRLRSLADRLVVSLALSDALVALCCPLLLDYYTLRALSWSYGLELCAAVSYVRSLSLHVSTNALLAIAVDRYDPSLLSFSFSPLFLCCLLKFKTTGVASQLAIVHPLRPRWRRSGAVVAAVWLVPALVSVPVVLTSAQTQFVAAGGLVKTFCGQVWTVDQRALYQAYFLSVMLLQFLLPVVVMATCYSQVCRELWFKVSPVPTVVVEPQTVPGEQTAQVQLRLLRRRRTVLVLVVVLAAFVFCWSPYYAFSVLRDFSPAFMSRQRHALTAFYAVDCLAMANGVFNTLCFVWVRPLRRSGAAARREIRLRSVNARPRPLPRPDDKPATETRATDTETSRGRIIPT